MRQAKRIDLVLSKINIEKFLIDNSPSTDKKIFKRISEKIDDNIHSIRDHWKKNPDLRLGQLLINEKYVPDHYKLYNVEEIDWLVDNKHVPVEEICFWGQNYDINNLRLPETKYVLLKDLNDGHIAAIVDLYEDGHMKVHKQYLEYFKKRLNK